MNYLIIQRINLISYYLLNHLKIKCLILLNYLVLLKAQDKNFKTLKTIRKKEDSLIFMINGKFLDKILYMKKLNLINLTN